MNRINERIMIVIVVLTLLVFGGLPAAAQAPQDNRPTDYLTPVILFPGWGGTRLAVRVHNPVSYTHLRAHETVLDLVCRLLLEKKKNYTHYCNPNYRTI